MGLRGLPRRKPHPTCENQRVVGRGRTSAESRRTGPSRTYLTFALVWLVLGGFGLLRSDPDSWQRTNSIMLLTLAALYVLAAYWWYARRK